MWHNKKPSNKKLGERVHGFEDSKFDIVLYHNEETNIIHTRFFGKFWLSFPNLNFADVKWLEHIIHVITEKEIVLDDISQMFIGRSLPIAQVEQISDAIIRKAFPEEQLHPMSFEKIASYHGYRDTAVYFGFLASNFSEFIQFPVKTTSPYDAV